MGTSLGERTGFCGSAMGIDSWRGDNCGSDRAEYRRQDKGKTAFYSERKSNKRTDEANKKGLTGS